MRVRASIPISPARSFTPLEKERHFSGTPRAGAKSGFAGDVIMTYIMTKPCPICAQQLIKQKPTDTVPCSCGKHVWLG